MGNLVASPVPALAVPFPALVLFLAVPFFHRLVAGVAGFEVLDLGFNGGRQCVVLHGGIYW